MRAWRRRDLEFRLRDEGIPKSCPSISSGRGFATGFMAAEMDVNVDYSSAEVALRSVLLFTENRVEAERDCLQEELIRNRMEDEQSEKSVL